MDYSTIPMTGPTLVPVPRAAMLADLLNAAAFHIQQIPKPDEVEFLVGDDMMSREKIVNALWQESRAFSHEAEKPAPEAPLCDADAAFKAALQAIFDDEDKSPARATADAAMALAAQCEHWVDRGLLMKLAAALGDEQKTPAVRIAAAQNALADAEPAPLPVAQTLPVNDLLAECLTALQHLTLGQCRAANIQSDLLTRLEAAVWSA